MKKLTLLANLTTLGAALLLSSTSALADQSRKGFEKSDQHARQVNAASIRQHQMATTSNHLIRTHEWTPAQGYRHHLQHQRLQHQRLQHQRLHALKARQRHAQRHLDRHYDRHHKQQVWNYYRKADRGWHGNHNPRLQASRDSAQRSPQQRRGY